MKETSETEDATAPKAKSWESDVYDVMSCWMR